MNIQRYYQRDAITDTFFAWSELPRVVGKLGTGGGKTVIAAGIIDQDREGRTLFLADQNELCEQPRNVIRRFSGLVADLEKATDIASLQSQVVVASSQTLMNPERLTRYPRDHFARIIIDEAHRGTERDIVIADRFPGARVLGLTATAYRKNLADLSRWYDGVAFEMSIHSLIEAGFAPRLRVMPMAVDIDLENVGFSRTIHGKDYNLQDLDTAIRPYYEEVARQLYEDYRDRHIIAYLPLIKSSKEFSEILRAHGLEAKHVDGESPDRDEIIQGFAAGQFNIITNSEVLSTGVDLPIADAMLDLSPTASMVRYNQRAGRLNRVLPGVVDDLPEEEQAIERRARIDQSKKPDVIVIDVLFQHERLTTMNAASLIADSEEEAKAIKKYIDRLKSPEELAEIKKRVQEEKEAQLIEAIDKAAHRTGGKVFDAHHIGTILQEDRLRGYEPVNRWELKPATDAQLRYIGTFGIDPDTVDTAGLASRLLNVMVFRRKHNLATLKQVQLMRRLQIEDADIYTIKEASKVISYGIEKRRMGQWI